MQSHLLGRFGQMIWQIDLPYPHITESLHLDLGSGSQPRNPFSAEKLIGVDIFEEPPEGFSIEFQYVRADITKRLPFQDTSFNSVSAYDVLEHVPRWERINGEIKFPFVSLMNEIWRILKPGGFFYAVTPMFPSISAFGDPTHVNVISRETISYFANPTRYASTLGYGFEGEFEILHSGWLRGAGPYDRKVSLRHAITESRSLTQKVYFSVKLARRFVLLLVKRKPSHTLWVLRKPN